VRRLGACATRDGAEVHNAHASRAAVGTTRRFMPTSLQSSLSRFASRDKSGRRRTRGERKPRASTGTNESGSLLREERAPLRIVRGGTPRGRRRHAASPPIAWRTFVVPLRASGREAIEQTFAARHRAPRPCGWGSGARYDRRQPTTWTITTD